MFVCLVSVRSDPLIQALMKDLDGVSKHEKSVIDFLLYLIFPFHFYIRTVNLNVFRIRLSLPLNLSRFKMCTSLLFTAISALEGVSVFYWFNFVFKKIIKPVVAQNKHNYNRTQIVYRGYQKKQRSLNPSVKAYRPFYGTHAPGLQLTSGLYFASV